MVLSEYGYDNPYNSKDYKTEYARYYYAFTKKLLSHDDCLRYVNDSNFRRNICNYKKNRKQREQREQKEKTIEELNVTVYNFDLDYDKDGIISEDKTYVFYKDKVYSKERFKYLNVIKSNKYGDYIRLNSGTYNNYKYIVKT
jgi:hypothetical protein